MAKLRAKIVGKKSAWAYYMAFHYTQEGATRENCAEWWKALEPSDKAKFEAQAAADRERFEKESEERDQEALREAEEKRLQNDANGPVKARARPKYVKQMEAPSFKLTDAQIEEGWQTTGLHVGISTLRKFPNGQKAIGKIVAILTKEKSGDGNEYFLNKHEDGDEEELELFEVTECMVSEDVHKLKHNKLLLLRLEKDSSDLSSSSSSDSSCTSSTDSDSDSDSDSVGPYSRSSLPRSSRLSSM